MDKYDESATCKKCGGSVISTRYDGILQTLIHRRCGRCGYVWTERALDYAPDHDELDSGRR